MEKQIGQMLIVGFRGCEIAPDSVIARDIEERNIGGIVLFDRDLPTGSSERNIRDREQVRALAESAKRLAGTPLLVSVDQEGGKVARLKPKHGFPATQSAWKLGQLPTADFERACDELAAMVAGVGINLNFAPVVDLHVNPENPIVGKVERSFSADPDVVARRALTLIDAHHRAGVLTSLKHFPGHGSSQGDTHLGMVEVTHTWTEKELEPFAAIVKAGKADMVMTAHVFNRRLDERYPATLSPTTIPRLLRRQIGFDGVVVSDDMQMGAIAQHYGLRDAIRLALEADIDMLTFGNNVAYDEEIAQKVIAIIVDLVRKKEIDEARLERSFERIRRLKARLRD